MIAAIVIASVIAYFVVGWGLARRMLPRFIETVRAKHLKDWPSSNPDKYILSDAKEFATLMIFFWPAMLPGRAFSGSIQTLVEQSDPARLRKRIAELEKELGMGADR